MTLRVPYEGFVSAVEQQLASRHVFVHSQAGKVLLTAAEAKHSVVIVSSTRKPVDEVRKELHAAGLHAHDGFWSVDDDQEILALPYVAAVSYRASKEKTGVWVEAYPEEPSSADVIRDFYDEISDEQSMPELSLEQFFEAAQVNLSIVTPLELERFLEVKNS
ncbi:MAG: hypothetical protein WCK51_08550 [Armatimonadota bacterium]